MSEQRYRPFSNGSQFGDWQASNCERCTKCIDGPNDPSPFLPPCQIESALIDALFDDGTVSHEMAIRMGYLDADGNAIDKPGEPPRYGWQCMEVEWTQEWIDECVAKQRLN